MKSIIFLDIDGVLVSYVDLKHVDKYGAGFIKTAVDALNLLIEHTDSDICISSSWRHSKSIKLLQELMDVRGVKGNVVGKTEHFGCRGEEIQKWLNDNEEYENFIIIDDEMTSIVNIIPFYFKTHIFTNPYRCLDIYDVGRICRSVWPDMPNFKIK